MNSVQENKLSMYMTVQKVTESYRSVWETLAAFLTFFTNFETVIAKIRATRLVQEGQITGVTKDKAEAQNNLIEKTVAIATAVFAYASASGNHELQDRVSYSPSDLRNSRDTILADRSGVVKEAGEQNVANLSDYGISQGDIDELNDLLNAYLGIIEDPRQAITNRSTATKELKDHFKEGDKILKEQLDKLMPQFKTTGPLFWQQYQNARMIIDLGRRN